MKIIYRQYHISVIKMECLKFLVWASGFALNQFRSNPKSCGWKYVKTERWCIWPTAGMDTKKQRQTQALDVFRLLISIVMEFLYFFRENNKIVTIIQNFLDNSRSAAEGFDKNGNKKLEQIMPNYVISGVEKVFLLQNCNFQFKT